MTLFSLMSKIELIAEDGNITFGLIQDQEGNKIYVSVPADDRKFKLFQKGDHIKCILYDKKKVLGFSAIVTNRIPGTTPVYEILSKDDFEVVQRREYVRVKTSLDIRYTDNEYLIDLNNDDFSKTEEIINYLDKYLKDGIASDISGGGLRLSCNESLKEGTGLLLIFNISDEVYIVKGEIMHKDISLSPTKSKYNYGIQFVNLNDKKREKIINYVFLLMRKNKLR